MDMHAALMSQVLKGRQLKNVDTSSDKRSPNPSLPPVQDDPRTALMNQIKAGVRLKTVKPNNGNPPLASQQVVNGGGLAGALAKALQERSKVLQQTDDEGQTSSSDDEWDDCQ